MVRRLIPCLMIATLALFGLNACQQAEESAEAADSPVTGQAAEAPGTAAEEAGAAAGEVVDEAAAEAKAKYEEVSTKIAEKKDELAAVQQQISEMSPQDLLTDDGKALKEKADGLMAEIGELEGELKALME